MAATARDEALRADMASAAQRGLDPSEARAWIDSQREREEQARATAAIVAKSTAQNTPAQDSQQVLKAEAPAPDATDRDAPASTSPIGGSMGTGQPAAAGPVGEAPTINIGQIVERLGFIVSAEFLTKLGFQARAVKNSRQYSATDFPRICAALAEHCLAVGERP